jgi:hypothetical protein
MKKEDTEFPFESEKVPIFTTRTKLVPTLPTKKPERSVPAQCTIPDIANGKIHSVSYLDKIIFNNIRFGYGAPCFSPLFWLACLGRLHDGWVFLVREVMLVVALA